MFGIKDKTVSFFIEIENLFNQIQETQSDELALQFLVLLLGKELITESEAIKATEDYIAEVSELKEQYEWIYNPPPLPTSSEQTENTIGSEFRKEFAETYGGYAEMIYLIATTFNATPIQVYEWTVVDFLFWANYLLHKKAVENIK